MNFLSNVICLWKFLVTTLMYSSLLLTIRKTVHKMPFTSSYGVVYKVYSRLSGLYQKNMFPLLFFFFEKTGRFLRNHTELLKYVRNSNSLRHFWITISNNRKLHSFTRFSIINSLIVWTAVRKPKELIVHAISSYKDHSKF